MDRGFYQETSHPGVGTGFTEGLAIMMGSGEAWAFTSNSEEAELAQSHIHTVQTQGWAWIPGF